MYTRVDEPITFVDEPILAPEKTYKYTRVDKPLTFVAELTPPVTPNIMLGEVDDPLFAMGKAVVGTGKEMAKGAWADIKKSYEKSFESGADINQQIPFKRLRLATGKTIKAGGLPIPIANLVAPALISNEMLEAVKGGEKVDVYEPAAKIAGEINKAAGIYPISKALGAATAAKIKLAPYIPGAPELAQRMVESASFWGTQQGIDEAYKYINKEKDLTLKNIIKSGGAILGETTVGGGLSVANAIPSLIIRLPAAGLVRFVYEASKEKLSNLRAKGLTPIKDNVEFTDEAPVDRVVSPWEKYLKTGFQVILATFSGMNMDEIKNTLGQRMQKGEVSLETTINKAGGLETTGKIIEEDITTSASNAAQFLPAKFNNLPEEAQKTFLTKTIDGLNTGEAVSNVIPNVIKEMGIDKLPATSPPAPSVIELGPPPEAKASAPMPDNTLLEEIKADILAGKPGEKIPVDYNEDGTIKKYGGIPSTYPGYFKNKGLTKNFVVDIIDKVLADKQLTEKQQFVLNDLIAGKLDEIQEVKNVAPAVATSPESTKELITGDLNLKPKDGEIKLVDGQTIIVDDTFGVLPVDGGDAGIKRSEAEGKEINQKMPYSEEGRLSIGTPQINKIETMPAQEIPVPKDFKLFKESEALIHKWGTRFGERKPIPSGASGVYYPKSTNIYLRGRNNISTATHELAHHIDTKFGISGHLLKTRGVSKSGNPIYIPETYSLRKEINKIYTKIYGGSQSHKLSKKVEEGLATLFDNYARNPTQISKEYPLLVQSFINPKGKYYIPQTTEFIGDVQGIYSRHQQLNSLMKIGARVVTDTGPIKAKPLMSSRDEFVNTYLDDLHFTEVVEKGQKGATFSLENRAHKRINSIIINNIKSNKGFWNLNDAGEYSKALDDNYTTLTTLMKKNGSTETFPYYLVTRDTKFNYDRLHVLELLSKEANNIPKEDVNSTMAKEIAALNEEVAELKDVLMKNNIHESEATLAYKENKNTFTEEEKIYDSLNKEVLKLLHHPKVGLINNKKFNELLANTGYAPLNRQFVNEILGPDMPGGKGKTLSMLKARTGGEYPIYDPVWSSMKNMAAAFKLAARQMTYNALLPISQQNPEMFEVVKASPKMEADPNVVIAINNYKKYAIYCNSEFKTLLDEVFTPKTLSRAEKAVRLAAKIYTKGTTSFFSPFAIKNFISDQTTIAAQSVNKTKPFLGAINLLYKSLAEKESPEAEFLEEYIVLGGHQQTYARMFDSSPEEVYKLLNKEATGIKKFSDYISKAEDIIIWPATESEMLTRAAEYVNARIAGKPQLVAMEEAGRVTGPFHHEGRLGGGTFGRTMLAAYPFAKPQIQGLAQWGRALSDERTRKQVMFVTAGVLAASLGGTAYLVSKGTEEQKQNFIGLHPEELTQGIYLPHPNGKSLIRLPSRETMAVPASIANMIISDIWLGGNYDEGDMMDAVTSILPTQLNPTHIGRWAFSLIPHILKGTVEVIAGKKSFPKLMELEAGLEDLPSGLRARAQTSPFGKWMGKEFGISPIKTDHLIESHLGRAIKPILGKEGGFDVFNKESYFTAMKPLQDFYELYDKNTKEYKAITKNITTHTPEERDKIMRTQLKLKEIKKMLKSYRDVQETDKRTIGLRKNILDKIKKLED